MSPRPFIARHVPRVVRQAVAVTCAWVAFVCGVYVVAGWLQ